MRYVTISFTLFSKLEMGSQSPLCRLRARLRKLTSPDAAMSSFRGTYYVFLVTSNIYEWKLDFAI